jgi:c-di-GMP-specific phosphodiesterase
VNALYARRGDLGHAIDMSIIAEGVETTHEMQALQAIGADHLQGYLLSRPLATDALVAWAHHRLGSDGQRTFPAA